MSKKTKVFKSIITAVLGIFLFYLSYIIAYILLGGIIHLLSVIPLISNLLGWFFTMRGDTPDMILSILVPTISYFVVMLIQEKVNRQDAIRGLSCEILGICLIVLNTISLVLNFLYGEGVLKSTIQIITGIVFFSSGKSLRDE